MEYSIPSINKGYRIRQASVFSGNFDGGLSPLIFNIQLVFLVLLNLLPSVLIKKKKKLLPSADLSLYTKTFFFKTLGAINFEDYLYSL